MSVVVITGGTQGIGRSIAEKFIAGGFDLAICSRTYSELEAFQKECNSKFPKNKVYIQQVDVRKKDEIQSFATQILNKFDQIAILVNNAGIFFPGSLLEEEDGHLEATIETNLYSAYYLTKALISRFINQGNGHIFNVSSIAATKAYPNGGSYSISKFALHGFSENLRYELKEKNIKVTTLTPGAVYTRSWEGFVAEERVMKTTDISDMVWAIYNLSENTVIENIVFRPQLGDV